MVMMFDTQLISLFASVVLLVLTMLIIGVHVYRNLIIMMLVIPVCLFCSFSVYKTVTTVLGYPVLQSISEKSIYLSHVQSYDDKWLYVWVMEPGDYRPKSFKIINTDSNRKQMEKAKQRQGDGVPTEILKNNGKNRQGEENAGDYLIYDFSIDNQGLKPYNNN
jgi:hypothetical protein